MNDSEPELTAADASAHPVDVELLEQLDGVLHRFGRLMASRQAQYGRSTGLPAPQYMVLRILLHEGEMRVSDIAATLGVKNPAASGLIQSLEEEGFVNRRHDDSDNRVVIVHITEAGVERFQAADRFRMHVLQELTRDLPAEDIATLIRVMSHMADVVHNGAELPDPERTP